MAIVAQKRLGEVVLKEPPRLIFKALSTNDILSRYSFGVRGPS
jgi:uncharacterized protein YndB with AHSA1/START domain